MQYAIPNMHLSAHHPEVNVPVLAYRSIGHTHNTFVVESIIDELAARAKRDPIEYRLQLLPPESKRQRGVLTLLREKAGWRRDLPANHAVGIALSQHGNTPVATAVEVSIEKKRLRVHRVTMTVDCGMAINPLTIEAQCQGGTIFGLTQAMPNGAITFKDGRVEQRNFDGYTPPYMSDAPPRIEVHVVPSGEAPTGLGEPPVPAISPAVMSAVASLTGKRVRSLPYRPGE
jgi:isoquinoline 1-oxidoreductase beta subunit